MTSFLSPHPLLFSFLFLHLSSSSRFFPACNLSSINQAITNVLLVTASIFPPCLLSASQMKIMVNLINGGLNRKSCLRVHTAPRSAADYRLADWLYRHGVLAFCLIILANKIGSLRINKHGAIVCLCSGSNIICPPLFSLLSCLLCGGSVFYLPCGMCIFSPNSV